MLTDYEETGMISIIRAASRRMTSRDLVMLEQARHRMVTRGRLAMLIDLGGVHKIARSGIAALVEFARAFQPGFGLGLFGARPAVARALSDCPLTSQFPVFSDKKEALASPDFRGFQLAGTKAVVLCAGAGSRMAPMTDTLPKPMLDVFGKPILEHLLTYLQSFGLRDFLLNPGHNAPAIHQQFTTTGQRSLFFLNEGAPQGSRWMPAPLGSASTLARLKHRHSAFDDDFLVLCGDALIDLDLAGLMESHKNSGAEVTIAAARVRPEETGKYGVIETDEAGRILGFQEKPDPSRARSTLVSTGIYVISPRALDVIPEHAGQDIATDLLPEILARGGHLNAYAPDFRWADFGCGRDYFDALVAGFSGDLPGVVPGGREIRPGVLADESARVDRRARISGPCYIGANAVIEKDTQIDGPCIIGANAHLMGGTLVRNSLVMAGTVLKPGIWADDMIVHTDWAVNHRQADGRKRSHLPLEAPEPVLEPQAAFSRWYNLLPGAVS